MFKIIFLPLIESSSDSCCLYNKIYKHDIIPSEYKQNDGRDLLDRQSEKSPTCGNLESNFETHTDQVF